MSAIRNTQTRRTHRSSQLPYARPTAKKPTWSFIGLLNYLNPLRSRSPGDSYDLSVDLEEDDEQLPNRQPASVAQSLSARGHQMAEDIDIHGRINALAGPSSQFHQPSLSPPLENFTPPTTPTRSGVPRSLQDSSSPASNIETVTNFLSERAGKSMSNSEVEGLVALLKKSTPPTDKSEPFRFSSGHSTPVHESSSTLSSTHGIKYSFNARSPPTSTPSPRKTLSRNPNGVYRWEGVGSAKATRSRNRYSSPAFGPSRPSSDRLVLKETQTSNEAPKTDAKRRKVGDESQSSSSMSSGTGDAVTNGQTSQFPARSAAPGPSPNRTAQAFPFPVYNSSPVPSRPPAVSPTPPPQPNGLPAATRLRTPAKPTAPVVPSPLRQAWSGSSSSSLIDSPQQTLQKQTKAANFMTELIKEVTPPKRPDLSNPYQTASPVGKVALPKARVGKRIRATGKPATPPATEDQRKEKHKLADQDKEYSQQAIIEATLPKGSKRSQPPAHFEKSPLSTSDSSPSPLAGGVSSSLASDRPHSSDKKSPKMTSYVVEEVDDDGKARSSKRHKPHPNEESKSRRPTPDIVIEEIGEMDVEAVAQKSPTPTLTSTGTFGVSSSGGTSPIARPLFPAFKPTLPKEPSKLRFSYRPEPGTSSAPSAPAAASGQANSNPLSAPVAKQSAGDKEENISVFKTNPKEIALATPNSALPTFVFTVMAMTLGSTPSHCKAQEEAKSVPKSSLPSFDFSPAALNSITEASKPASMPIKAFDWGAAGMKKPSGGGEWTCSTCMLLNPTTATDKCSICQTPR